MPNTKTLIRAEFNQLAYEYTDMTANLIYNKAMPGLSMNDETGTFRIGDTDEHFEEHYTKMTKFTIAEESGEADTTQNFQLLPAGDAFSYSELDLQHPQKFGANSRQEMVNNRIMKITGILKKVKEKAFYTAVNTDANYQSSSYYADAAIPWDQFDTADPIVDIYNGKLLVPAANALIMPQTSFWDLQRNAKLQSLTNVAGPQRDGNINPTITVDWLANVFQLQYIWVASGKFKTDSSVSASTAKSNIWGDKALLFYFNPSPTDIDGRFMKHLFLAGASMNPDEGWIVTETTNPEPGGLGVTRWQIVSYYQFLPHRKELGYRIDTLTT